MNRDFLQNQTADWPKIPGQPGALVKRAAQPSPLQLLQDPMKAAFVQEVIDASGSHIAILDESHTILYVNRAWRQFASRTGSTAGQFGIGSKYPDMGLGTAAASTSDATAISMGIDRVINKEEIEFEMEYRCTAVAEPVWFRLHAAGFQLPNRKGNPMILISHDNITAERHSDDSLRKDRERLERLCGTTNILPWEADAKTWVFTYVGDQSEKMLGYDREMWFEPDFWTTHIHPDDRERAVEESSRLARTTDQYQFEYRMIAKDGRVVWINDIVSVHREMGFVVSISGFMIDITEQKQAADTLRLLGGRLIAAQEEERKRIARELHDDLNQRMALMSIELEQIGQMLAITNEGTAERIKGLQEKVIGISTEIHRISYALHPSKLDHLGLVPALKSFCDELSESRGLRIDFRHKGFPAALSPDTTLCIFRIAQEGLHNAAKHSGTPNVDVVLKKTDRTVELTISDAGCGFDMNNGKMTAGLGFISMKERLRLMNGHIKIESKPAKGTQIQISVPLAGVATARATRF